MANLVISGDTSGSVTLSAPAVSGTTVLTLPTVSGTIVTTAGATELTTSGNLTFTGTGNRITGDFSNSTVASRVAIQTSTTNGNTGVFLLPNGTANVSAIRCFNNSDPTNAAFIGFDAFGTTDARITSGITGTGTYLPMVMYTNGSERLRIDTSGNVGIGTTSPVDKLTVVASGSALSQIDSFETAQLRGSSVSYLRVSGGSVDTLFGSEDGVGTAFIGSYTNHPVTFRTNNTERMRIESGGNVLVGTTTAVGRFTLKQGGGNSFGSSLALVRNDNTNNWQAVIGGDNQLYLGYNSVTRGTFNDSTGVYTSVSDSRLKKNISDITYGLNEILKLRSVEYHMNEESTSKLKNLGFIAQEAQEVIPESVSEMMGGTLGMDKSSIIPVLVKAIQEQQALITQLQLDVAALKGTE
jgi:Chaperone of endosialidase